MLVNRKVTWEQQQSKENTLALNTYLYVARRETDAIW